MATVYGLEVKSKDVRKMRFYFRARQERDRALSLVQSWSFFLRSPAQLKSRIFAYAHACAVMESASNNERGCSPTASKSGWAYDIDAEYARLKFDSSKFIVNRDANRSYSLCTSYPEQVITPACVNASTIQSSAAFRSSCRFPAVCWVHPHNSATISRCSQPQVGIRGSRDAGDEALVGAIFSANPRISNTSKPMYIIDCRPQTAAAANYIKGAGYENSNYYVNCKLMFMNIQNIHAMRSSFKALTDLCARETGEIPDRAAFESTRWLDHIQLLLKAAVQMAKLVHEEGRSLLVHCSDGWDRTPQLTSLVQLLLDPFYRTIKGFSILIQKEWLAFGHKFADRLGLGQVEEASPEISPIFIQWLDCIFQIVSQFPNAFEFTEEYLLAIVDQVLSNQFGNFIGNSAREREVDLNISTQTLCVWKYFESEILERKKKNQDPVFINPQHSGSVSEDSDPLYPILSTSKFFIWDRFYQRYHYKFQESHSQVSQTRSVARKAAILQRQVHTLKKNLATVSQEKKMLHAALQAALASQVSPSAASQSTSSDQIRQELDRLRDMNLTPSQQQRIQIQFYIKDGVIVKCFVREDKPVEVPPNATKFVPDLVQYTIEDYTASAKKRKPVAECAASEDLLGGAAILAHGPLIRVQEPPQHLPRVMASMVDDDEYFDFDDSHDNSAAVEAVPGGVPLQLLSIGYSELMKYWSKIWRAKSGAS